MTYRLLRSSLFSCFLVLGGCSQNTNDVVATFQSAFGTQSTLPITAELVDTIPYATIQVNYGESPSALMILTWAEPTKDISARALKWLSADKEMVVTLSGRVIKTVGIKRGNLVALHSKSIDPLSQGLQKPDTPKTWDYTLSWQPGYHWYYQAHSIFTVGQLEEKSLLTGKQTLLHVMEDVSVEKINQNYRNHYWLNAVTGQVVVSEQYIYPGAPLMKVSIAKPFRGE